MDFKMLRSIKASLRVHFRSASNDWK